MSQVHHITRRIEIDAGHRVPDHKSKCFNLHGHRYVIEAECEGPLATAGEQTGMVVDFGFLKGAMMERIHGLCDHTFIFSCYDNICLNLFTEGNYSVKDEIRSNINKSKAVSIKLFAMNYYIVPFPPTAENLARHWFELLEPDVRYLSEDRATLTGVRVWETPNCMAEYRRPFEKSWNWDSRKT